MKKSWRATIVLWLVALLIAPVMAAPRPVAAYPDAWWNESWDYRNVLAFNTSGLSENLTWFPVLVKFTAARFDFDKIEAGGADLRFIDKLGTDPLPYEIDYWNDTTEEGYVWVRVPQIAQGAAYSDYFWVYYGNAAAADAQDAVHVWGGPDVTVDNDTGIATGAPITIVGAGSTTVDVTQAGNLTVTLPVGGTGFAKTGDTANVTGSPVTLYPGENTVVVEDTGNITIEIGGYVAVYHMNDDATNSTQILDSTANNNTGQKGTLYATASANWTNSTGICDGSPVAISGTATHQINVTQAGTFNITVPANQVLLATNGTANVTPASGTAGAKTFTVVGTGNIFLRWKVRADESPTEVAGGVGRAQQFVGAPYAVVSDYIQIPHHASLAFGAGDWSIVVLVSRDATGSSGGPAIIRKRSTTGPGWDNAESHLYPLSASGIFGRTDFSPPTDSVWRTYAVSVNQSASPYVKGFVNGVFDAGGYDNENAGNLGSIDNAQPVTIGWSAAGEANRSFGGLISELRLSSVARSAEWVEHENLAITDTLLYYGNEDPPPTVATVAASGIAMNAAGVTSGNFNGNITSLGGSPVCNASFQYGLTAAYGSQTALVEKSATGLYAAAIPNNLIPGATYHFRANATNVDGSGNGDDASFTLTLPTIATLAATNVHMDAGGTSAILRGSVSNMGVATSATVHFEWGYTTAYGTTVGSQTASGTGTYTYTLTGFDPAKTVYYRFVSTNGAVVTNGAAKTVTEAAETGYTLLRLIPLLVIAAIIILAWKQRENGPIEVFSIIFIGILIFLAVSAILQSMW